MTDKIFPNEWIESTLAEICYLNPKNTLADDTEVGFLPMNGVPKSFGEKNIFEVKNWSEVKKGYTHFADGDTIFAKITPCFENSKASIIEKFPNGHGSGSTEYFVLRPIGNYVNPKLLLAIVRTNEFLREGAANMSGSVGHKRVPKEFVENFVFPLAALAEQQQIAQKLDELLAQVDTLKARLDAIPKILKRFRQSVLAAAVGGRLTDKAPSSKNYELGAVAKFIDYRGKTPTKVSEGIPLITAKNIRQGYISREPREYIAESDYLPWMTRGIPKVGNVLITTEAPLGNVASIDITEKFALAQRAICLQFNEVVVSKFACMYMQALPFQEALISRATGTTVKGIKASELKKIILTLPSIDEQTEIVRRVEQLFAYADQIEQRVKDAQARVNHLTQSILAKAFRGELTADWRAQNPDLISGENSAAALLERIKAEREVAGKAKKKKA